MSQNYTLVGCSAEAGQDQHLKLSPQNHIFYLKAFFNKKHSKRPRQISMAGNL